MYSIITARKILADSRMYVLKEDKVRFTLPILSGNWKILKSCYADKQLLKILPLSIMVHESHKYYSESVHRELTSFGPIKKLASFYDQNDGLWRISPKPNFVGFDNDILSGNKLNIFGSLLNYHCHGNNHYSNSFLLFNTEIK